MSLMPLLIRPSIYEGESLSSYLYRAGEANGYSRPNRINLLVQDELGKSLATNFPRDVITFQHLSSLTRLDPLEIYAATPHIYAPVINHPTDFEPTIMFPGGHIRPLIQSHSQIHFMFPQDRAQYCPYCIQEKPYHRLIWQLQTVSACLKHQCILVMDCVQCNAQLSIPDVVKGTCPNCGFQLSEAEPISIATVFMVNHNQVRFQSWLNNSPYPNDINLPNEPINVLYVLLAGLIRAYMSIDVSIQGVYELGPYEEMFPIYSTKRLTPIKSYRLMQSAMNIMSNWPNGFYTFLDCFLKRDKAKYQNAEALEAEYGTLYQTLIMGRWNNPPFDFIQAAFGEHISRQKVLTVPMISTRWYQNHKPPFEWVNSLGAARLLGVPHATVKKLVQKGKLNEPIGVSKKVRVPEVELLRRVWQHSVPIGEAASILGTSPSYVEWLIEFGHLRPVRGPKIDGHSRIYVDDISLEQTLTQLRQQETRHPGMIEDGLTLLEAEKELSKWGLYLPELFKGIYQERIYYYLHPPALIKDIRISPDEIRWIKEQIRDCNHLWNIQQVADYLTLGERTVRMMIHARTINPIDSGEHGVWFVRNTIFEFRGKGSFLINVDNWRSVKQKK